VLECDAFVFPQFLDDERLGIVVMFVLGAIVHTRNRYFESVAETTDAVAGRAWAGASGRLGHFWPSSQRRRTSSTTAHVGNQG
jgi:hypothetical protein